MNTYIIFDFETSGINSKYAEIIEISAIKIKDNNIVQEFNTLIKPSNPIDPSSTAINGITDDMVIDAPNLREILPKFIEFLGNNILLGYNISSFDLPILRRVSAKILNIDIHNEYLDVLYMAREQLPDLSDHKLSTIASYFDISTDGAHRALTDCYIINKCYQSLLRLSNDASVSQNNRKSTEKIARNTIKISEIKAKTTDFDTSNPFYMKQCVFTGELHAFNRKTAMQAVVDAGGILKSSVTKNTDYLIVGHQDSVATKRTGISKKERDANANQLKGYPIKILYEQEFLKLLAFHDKRTKIELGNESYYAFKDTEERDAFLKKYKLLSQNPRKEKIFYYKGRNASEPAVCTILGYAREYSSSATLVIDYGCGEFFILSDYLKQMQSPNFSLDNYTGE